MVDYDRTKIPERYDRSRDHGPAVLDLWMDAVASIVGPRPVDRILDVGCGTGRFSAALARRFNATVIGLRTGVRERIDAYPYVPFFPTTPAMIRELLPDLDQVRGWFEAAGFRLMSSQVITQTIAPTWAAYVDKVAAGLLAFR